MHTTKLLLGKEMKNISRSKKDKILQFLIDDLKFDIKERKELLKGEPNELKKEIQEIIAILRNRTRDEMLLRAN